MKTLRGRQRVTGLGPQGGGEGGCVQAFGGGGGTMAMETHSFAVNNCFTQLALHACLRPVGSALGMSQVGTLPES